MIIIAIVLLLLVGIISLFNGNLVVVDLYVASFSVPLWVTFVAFLLIGMLIAALFATAKGAKDRQVIKNKNDELARAETEKEEAIARTKEKGALELQLQKQDALIRSLQADLHSKDATDPIGVEAPAVQTTTVIPETEANAHVEKVTQTPPYKETSSLSDDSEEKPAQK